MEVVVVMVVVVVAVIVAAVVAPVVVGNQQHVRQPVKLTLWWHPSGNSKRQGCTIR